jgi:hypothetical protein
VRRYDPFSGPIGHLIRGCSLSRSCVLLLSPQDKPRLELDSVYFSQALLNAKG